MTLERASYRYGLPRVAGPPCFRCQGPAGLRLQVGLVFGGRSQDRPATPAKATRDWEGLLCQVTRASEHLAGGQASNDGQGKGIRRQEIRLSRGRTTITSPLLASTGLRTRLGRSERRSGGQVRSGCPWRLLGRRDRAPAAHAHPAGPSSQPKLLASTLHVPKKDLGSCGR